MDSMFMEGMQTALHAVSQVLLVPVMLVLLALIVYALYCLGSLIAENFTEHRHLSVSIANLMDDIDGKALDQLPSTIEKSGLLRRQKSAISELLAHAQLPLDDLLALARRLSHEEEDRYGKVVGRTDFVAKVGPMFGLMGTLIPLGPGIVALGNGDTEALSSALLIAFDTTTAGLIAAAIALLVSKIRLRWYANYGALLDAVMTAVLKKLRDSSEQDQRALAAAMKVRAAVSSHSSAAGGKDVVNVSGEQR